MTLFVRSYTMVQELADDRCVQVDASPPSAPVPMPAPNEKALRKGHVAVRLDPATIARLDALLPLYALPGRSPTRSDGLRAVILAGLDVEEQRAAREAQRGSASSGGTDEGSGD
jgi:hypothetical protein